MGWEVEKLKRTLFIEQVSMGGKTTYAIYPLCRVTTDTGTTYLEPLPNDMLLGVRDVWRFNAVEFIDGPVPQRGDNVGDLNLTNVREVGVRRGA